MSESTPAEPRVLVLHNRELGDVCGLLDELGAAYQERSSVTGSGAKGLRLVVATPQRVLELQAAGDRSDGTTVIAVCDGFSKTLAAKLSHARVDFVLRRPAHPGALRLLLMHALYRGPEKRRFRRVSVGAPIRVRLGWLPRAALLLELSTTGGRVLLDRVPSPGARLQIALPPEMTGRRRPLRIRGRVVRTVGRALDDPLDRYEVAVQFDTLREAAFAAVSALVHEHARGPAPWKGAPVSGKEKAASQSSSGSAGSAVSAAEILDRRSRERKESDRRSSPRLRYAKPVLAKREGASRVLMGRDLSTGGMRVQRDHSLSVGDELKIALYGEDGIPPLMLKANVAREDGPFLMLRFEELGEPGVERLRRIMNSLPLSGSDDAGCDTPMVVSEIVEQG